MKWISETDFRWKSLLLVALLPLAPLGAQEGDNVKLIVHPEQVGQRVEHFGTSAAWWAQSVGAWKVTARDQVLDLLFDAQKGIGLTLVRYNIGGGKENSGIADPWRSAASPLAADGTLDWNRDAAAVGVVDGAVARGASVLLFANTPPTSLTVTGKPSGNGGRTNLKSNADAAFARFLADCAQSLATRWHLVAVSPINEPQWDWNPSKGQEGSYYSPAEALRLVKAVVQEFRSRSMKLPVSVFDSAEWSLARNREFVAQLASAPELWPYLTPYAVHSYWSDVFDKEELTALVNAKLPGLGLWQTEWTEMKSGRDTGMTAALTLAQVVHEDLTVGQVSSWQGWIAASKYDYADGLVYVDEARQTVTPTKKLWALGQWSRFVRPGAQRVAVEVDPSAGVNASAFLNADGALVLVLVNGSDDPSVALDLGLAGTWNRWETSEAKNLEVVASNGALVVLPPRSVTTFVQP